MVLQLYGVNVYAYKFKESHFCPKEIYDKLHIQNNFSAFIWTETYTEILVESFNKVHIYFDAMKGIYK
jgi:hypothetical protein